MLTSSKNWGYTEVSAMTEWHYGGVMGSHGGPDWFKRRFWTLVFLALAVLGFLVWYKLNVAVDTVP